MCLGIDGNMLSLICNSLKHLRIAGYDSDSTNDSPFLRDFINPSASPPLIPNTCMYFVVYADAPSCLLFYLCQISRSFSELAINSNDNSTLPTFVRSPPGGIGYLLPHSTLAHQSEQASQGSSATLTESFKIISIL